MEWAEDDNTVDNDGDHDNGDSDGDDDDDSICIDGIRKSYAS